VTPVGQFEVPPDHPALPGHFPGHPVVPGVVLLDETFALILAAHPGRTLAGLQTVKFTAPVGPGQPVDVAWEPAHDSIDFACTSGNIPVLHGRARLAP